MVGVKFLRFFGDVCRGFMGFWLGFRWVILGFCFGLCNVVK